MDKYILCIIFISLLPFSSVSLSCNEKRKEISEERTTAILENFADSVLPQTIFLKLFQFLANSLMCYDYSGSLLECPMCMTVADLFRLGISSSSPLRSAIYFYYWYSIEQVEFCRLHDLGQMTQDTARNGLLSLMLGIGAESRDYATEDGQTPVTLSMFQTVVERLALAVSQTDETCQGNNKLFTATDIFHTYSEMQGELQFEDFGDAALEVVQRLLTGECYANETIQYTPTDHAYSVFNQYANSECELGTGEFENLANDLGIGGARHHERNEDEHGHERKKRSLNNTTLIDECYSMDYLVQTIGKNSNITVDDFLTNSPILLQQALQGCSSSKTNEETARSSLTTGETYGYGSIAILIVSLLSLLGVLIYPCRHSSAYPLVLSLMLGLAVGSLTGDAFLHLLPHGIGLHDDQQHSNEEYGMIEPYMLKMLCACGTLWLFYVIQLWVIAIKSSCSKNNGDDLKKANEINAAEDTGVAWMVMIGDAIHNFADGLAVGAASTVSWQTCLSTTIAIAVHELPHEFGDVAVLLQVGWTVKQVILCQLGTALTAFAGLYVGIAVSGTESSTEWIFMAAAGMFLYVAVADVIPELHRTFKAGSPCGVFITSNVGILIGFGSMLILTIYEKQIEI